MKLTLVDRLKKHSASNGECIEWTGYRNTDGYGRIRVDGKSIGAHRIAWKLAYGEIPDEMQVLHKCDNRSCINPKHLFLGTQVENIADMCAKGRQARAERASSTKLRIDDVRAIREDGRLKKEIANDYRVDPSIISRIKSRKIWRHVA